jgi:hypothetical protein
VTECRYHVALLADVLNDDAEIPRRAATLSEVTLTVWAWVVGAIIGELNRRHD